MFRNFGLVRRLLPYLRPRRKAAAGVVALAFAGAVVALAAPWPLALLIDSVLGHKPLPSWMGFLTDATPTTRIVMAVSFGLVLVAIQSVISVIKQWLETRLELGMVLDFRSDIFEHIQRLSWQYHDQGMAGRFIYQTNYIAHEAGSAVTVFIPLAQAALTLIGMFIITYRLGPSLALSATVVLPFLVTAMRYYGRRIEPELLKVRELEGDSMAIVHEKLSIIKVVNSFARERYEHARFRAQAKEGLDQRVRVTVRQTMYSLGVALIMALGTAVVLVIGAHSVINRQLTVGELLVVVAYLAAVYQPLETISGTIAGLQQQLLQLRVVFDVLDTPIHPADRAGALPLESVSGRIEFDGVSFTYAGRGPTLQDIDLVIEPGSRLALVGATGAGKSTLAALIPRYYEVSDGAVRIDGVDVRDLPLEWLRSNVSVVMQEPILFADTIAANIQYGRLDASWAALVQAAKDAGAHDFIEQLPHGYGTRIGERGSRLSGGERQRIAIARAFLKDAPILILDEPTSAIDSRTENGIIAALDRLAAGRTTVVIAHRLSTIRSADRIGVVDAGRLVEIGTHDELMARPGRYAELWTAQTFGRAVDAPSPSPTSELPRAVDGERSELTTAAGTSTHTGVASPRRPRVVVLGMMTKMPVAGVVWQTLHYLLGLEQCGCEAWYVEAHARTPSMLMRSEHDDGARRAATFIDATMRRFGLAGRWAFHALHDDGAVYGMTAERLDALYTSADLIINLHGGTLPREEFARTGRLVYVETDPVQLEVELSEGLTHTKDFLAAHVELFTFGENIGRSNCGVPAPSNVVFHATRQPVVIDHWRGRDGGPGRAFTTIGNWRQEWRDVQLGGERYGWSKHAEWERILSLPSRCTAPFELALASVSAAEIERIRGHGWGVVSALDISSGIDAYRRFVTSSTAEITVAKDQNVRLRTGWFSDRSATYLAAGRPVITQDTGFASVLPTGDGLFAFNDLDGAMAAVEAVLANPAKHRRAAADLAVEYFDATKVIGAMLGRCGIAVSRTAARPRRPDAFPASLDVRVVGRHPTIIPASTVAHVLAAPPLHPCSAHDLGAHDEPDVSIIVVTHGQLAVTRLCLESLLVNTAGSFELVVVDNGSQDLTPQYLQRLADDQPIVRIVLLHDNVGFAAAVNLGVKRARGTTFVIVNNDVVFPSPWLATLTAHLDDPAVGMVGPVSPGAPNEAQVPADFSTYDELCASADRRAHGHAGRFRDLEMLAMFCVAIRREVWDSVGPLDEQFGLGLFEDDDYSMRVRAAGWVLRCAEDCLVHHLGQASFGDLVPTGVHAELFERNRRRFEQKWSTRWTSHSSPPPDGYSTVVAAVRDVIARVVPTDAGAVLVVSKGDEQLVDVRGRDVRHFPQSADGGFAGHHPASTDDIARQLHELAELGAEYFLIPATSLWWLDHYEGLDSLLDDEFVQESDDEGGRLFRRRERIAAPVSR